MKRLVWQSSSHYITAFHYFKYGLNAVCEHIINVIQFNTDDQNPT